MCDAMDNDDNRNAEIKRDETLQLVLASSLIHNDDSNVLNPLLKDAAIMLSKQWHRGGSPQDYVKKMTSNRQGLPASYLLIKSEKQNCSSISSPQTQVLIGHARLTECFEGLAGSATAATYIIIDEDFRGCGHGSRLMRLLEEESVKLGYHYMYLWTHTATNFYKKLGYQETERVSLHRACLKPLESEQVNRLEDMLRVKQEKISSALEKLSTKDSRSSVQVKVVTMTETILLPPTDENAPKENDVWLRKRLVEFIRGSIDISLEERIEEIKNGINCYMDRRKISSQKEKLSWKYHMVQIPWQQQVGPSCGLASLRMLRDYYQCDIEVNHDVNDTIITQEKHQHKPSLLNEAKVRGYTDDGEIFDANDLVTLATEFCGLNCCMHSLQQLTPNDILRMLGPIEDYNVFTSAKKKNGLLILPYDTQKMTKLPLNNAGLTAHYGIIVGLVFGFQNCTQGCKNDCMLEALVYTCENEIPSLEDVPEILMLVQHSLSPKLSIASWNEFYESNQQIVSFDKIKYPTVRNLNLKDCIIEFSSMSE